MLAFSHGDSGIRTHDLLNAIQALSQLSYTPMGVIITDKRKFDKHYLHFFRPPLTGPPDYGHATRKVFLKNVEHISQTSPILFMYK